MNKLTAPAFALLLALSLTACPGGIPAPTSAAGTISNWPAGKTATLDALVSISASPSGVTQTTIDTGGNFTLALPSADTIAPYIAAGSITNPCAGVTVTPNVKGAGLNLVVKNASQTSVGNLFLASGDVSVPGTTSFTQAFYFYVNSDWNATGTCTTTGGSVTQTFNVQAKSGWNVIIGQVAQGNVTYTNGAVPANVKWIFTGSASQLSVKQLNFNWFSPR
jgi:hypothetical protein